MYNAAVCDTFASDWLGREICDAVKPHLKAQVQLHDFRRLQACPKYNRCISACNVWFEKYKAFGRKAGASIAKGQKLCSILFLVHQLDAIIHALVGQARTLFSEWVVDLSVASVLRHVFVQIVKAQSLIAG